MALDPKYLSGFFDGEGNVDIYHIKPTSMNPYGQYRLKIQITQSDITILEVIREEYGGSIHRYLHTKGIGCGNVSYRWNVYGPTACLFLRMIQPLSFVKREEVEIAIAFQGLLRRGGKGRGIRLTPDEVKTRERLYGRFRELREDQKARRSATYDKGKG